MLQVATNIVGIDKDRLPVLSEYVGNPVSVLERIVEHYGMRQQQAKTAVLLVLGGGDVATCVKDAGCMRNESEVQPDLRELRAEATVAREALFTLEMFKEEVAHVRSNATANAKAVINDAERWVLYAPPSEKETARRRLGDARRKASHEAIDRSLMSDCIKAVEASVMDKIDEWFQRNGWPVDAFLKGALLVQPNSADVKDEETEKWKLLESVMRGAEDAVRAELNLDVTLYEKHHTYPNQNRKESV